MILLWVINLSNYFGSEIVDPGDDDSDTDDWQYLVLITKFICSVILHVTLQPKVDEAIKRFKYVKYHPYKFENITITIIICFMKLFVECGTELVSLAITATYTDSLDIVMNYIALSVISELDEVYFKSLSSPLKD